MSACNHLTLIRRIRRQRRRLARSSAVANFACHLLLAHARRVFFTCTTLLALGSTHPLFLASISCIGLTVVARLLIALSNWPQVETGSVIRSTLETGYIPQKFRTGKDRRLQFLLYVPLYLIEPSSGRRFLKKTLRESVSQMGVDGTSQDMHSLAI